MKTAQQLAWLCTTFGVLKWGQVAYSEVVCGTIRFEAIGFHSSLMVLGLEVSPFHLNKVKGFSSLVVPRGISY